jgi:hypothetical protein
MAEPQLAKAAYDKQMEFKGAVPNHLVAQLIGFACLTAKQASAPTICPMPRYTRCCVAWAMAGPGVGIGLNGPPNSAGAVLVIAANAR